MSSQTSVSLTEVYSFVVNSEGLISSTEYLTLCVSSRINRWGYNRIRTHIV